MATVNKRYERFDYLARRNPCLVRLQSVTHEVAHTEDVEESQTIAPIDVIEQTPAEEQIESLPTIVVDDEQKIVETGANTKSWWSSLVRLFHFGNHSSAEVKSAADHDSACANGGSYLSNVKCRRSLHGDSLVG